LEEGVGLALRTIDEQPDEVTELRAVSPLVSAWLCSGKPDQACAMTERMLEPALRLREQVPQAPGWVMSLHLPALIIAGRIDDADAATALVEKVIASSGAGVDATGFVALAHGMSCLHRGQVASASDWLRQSVSMMRPIARWRLPFALVYLTEASALAGDAEGAARASEEADVLVAHHGVFEGIARVARGWRAQARGEHSAAIELWLDAAEWSAEHGHRTAELLALHEAVRFAALREAGERLQAVAATCEGRWAPCFAAHARAVADGDGAALEAAAAGFVEIGALLLAAEATARASSCFRLAGLRSRADRAAARAWELAARCEGARTPVLVELERPLPLTRREREVAALAADGLTAQAVADRLFLSVRTVEGHLQSAYRKLGVNDRHALATLLRPAGDA
jgi:DNA-binding CsgD family transcriptional regulator